MRYMWCRIMCLIVYAAVDVALLSCDNNGVSSGREDLSVGQENLQEEEHEIGEYDFDAEMRMRIKKLKEAVALDDAATVASLCRYPIERSYPIHDILDSVEMAERYDEVFDQKIKNAITSSKSDDWGGINWCGYTLGDGEWIWFDEDIYLIPYHSDYEKFLRNKLIKEDLSSLKSDLARSWFPEICLLDSISDTIYRIDLKELDSYMTDCRIMAYKTGFVSKDTPSFILYGIKEIQGSAATRCYVFSESDILEWTICNYWYENKIVLYIMKDGEIIERRDLKKVYWLDMIDDK